jgi:3-hydroxybutyryl-CoA dehydrogenase
MSSVHQTSIIAVIGAGTMGAGIAQVSAAHGHTVLLHDAAPDAAHAAKASLGKRLQGRVARGKMTADEAAALLERIRPVAGLDDLAPAGLVIEAIIEDLTVKQDLFKKLEAIVDVTTILATNTSSISITSIARCLETPGRVVGMHFFNPAPVMKLVEVICGLATSQHVAQQVFDLALGWGKVAVYAKSTPGFIVNRVARPFYAEALRLFEENVADPATIDALMTQGGGFRMGPFELMDLIGNDVNYTVSKSVFDAFHHDPRFRPSLAQLELVNAGHFGAKSGQGFYVHGDGVTKPAPRTSQALEELPALDGVDLAAESEAEGICFIPTDGRLARDVARQRGKPVVLFDVLNPSSAAPRLGFATSPDVTCVIVERFIRTMNSQNIVCTHLPDWPGLIVMRTIAMLANEGFNAVLQGVATEADVDLAMRFGVNYPLGPIQWARAIGLERVLCVLDTLHSLTGDPRYRASLNLRIAATA